MAAERKIITADEGDEDLDRPEPKVDEEEILVGQDEERLPAGEFVSLEHEPSDDPEVEERRARRREERKRQKTRDREYRRTLEDTVRQQANTIADLSGRVSNVESHARAGGVQQIDQAIANAHSVAKQMSDAMADAVKTQNGQLLAEAQERWLDAKVAIRDLEGMKANAARRPAAPAIDPAVTAMSQGWAARHPWYKPGTNDEDTVIATSIDALVNASGLDPRTSEYWEELDRRLARRLPHRYKGKQADDDGEDDDEDPEPRGRQNGERRRTPRTGGSGSGRVNGDSGERYFLSAARISAMKDDGSWDDPEKKKRRIDYYKKYDAEHRGQGR